MKSFIKHKIRQFLLKEERVKANMPIPNDIINIAKVFNKNGYDIYVVGGSVRDFIQNKTPKDFDLATNALPDDVENILNNAGYRTLPTGKAFGVINVFTDTDEYEIATFRSETYNDTDKRRPNEVKFTDIETDAKRRDLTINALYYDINKKEIIDLVGGIQDIKNGTVRTVGDPNDRFEEDRLRKLRAIRFAGRFQSKLDDITHQSLTKNNSLDGISNERIMDEFIKGIRTSKSVVYYLNLINQYGLFKWVLNGLKHTLDFIESHDHIIVIANLIKINDVKTIRTQLNKLTYPIKDVSAISFLVQLLTLNIDNAVLLKKQQKNSQTTDEQILLFGKLNNIDNQLLNAFINFDFTLSGDEVMSKYDLKPSKELGDLMYKLETDNFKKLLK